MSIADMLRGRLPDIGKSIADHENQVAETVATDIAHQLKVEENKKAFPSASPKLVEQLTPRVTYKPPTPTPNLKHYPSPTGITPEAIAAHPLNRLRKGK